MAEPVEHHLADAGRLVCQQRAAMRAASARRRERNRAARLLIGGRLVATTAREHGTQSTYTNHGCQCQPCMAAGVAGSKRRRPVPLPLDAGL